MHVWSVARLQVEAGVQSWHPSLCPWARLVLSHELFASCLELTAQAWLPVGTPPAVTGKTGMIKTKCLVVGKGGGGALAKPALVWNPRQGRPNPGGSGDWRITGIGTPGLCHYVCPTTCRSGDPLALRGGLGLGQSGLSPGKPLLREQQVPRAYLGQPDCHRREAAYCSALALTQALQAACRACPGPLIHQAGQALE